MKHTTAALLATCMAVVFGLPAQAEMDDDVYAEVNGTIIDKKMIDLILNGQEVPDDQLRQIVQQLASAIVLAKHAEEEGYSDRKDVQLEIEMLRQATLGRAYIREYIEKNPVTVDQIEESFQTLSNVANGRQEYRVRHILVESEAAAKEINQSISGDLAMFIEKAKTESIDTGSGINGGELGWAAPENFVPEFSAGMTALQPGNFSAPIQSQFGWHLIYLDDVRDTPAPELTEQLRQQLSQNLEQSVINDELDRLQKDADLKFNEKFFPNS